MNIIPEKRLFWFLKEDTSLDLNEPSILDMYVQQILTRGTALAEFYLKHRKSNDLDFFTSTEELIIPYSYSLEEVLKIKGMSVQRQRGFGSFVELLVNRADEATVIHLALDSSFRFEQTKVSSEYPKLKVDSLVDIASNKLLALFSRATLRYFITAREYLPDEVGRDESASTQGVANANNSSRNTCFAVLLRCKILSGLPRSILLMSIF